MLQGIDRAYIEALGLPARQACCRAQCSCNFQTDILQIQGNALLMNMKLRENACRRGKAHNHLLQLTLQKQQ